MNLVIARGRRDCSKRHWGSRKRPGSTGIAGGLKDLAYLALLDGESTGCSRCSPGGYVSSRRSGTTPMSALPPRVRARLAPQRPSRARDARDRSAPNGDCLLTAARIWAAGDVPREAAGLVGALPLQDRYEQDLSALRATLGEVAFARAQAEGRTLSLDQAVEQALAASGAGSSPPQANPSSAASARDSILTRREQEVSILVAQGLSNPQMAAQLGLSDRTIDAHLRNIMGKLGVTSRAQVAAWSVRQGLGAPHAEEGHPANR